jgi:hypothetical protein
VVRWLHDCQRSLVVDDAKKNIRCTLDTNVGDVRKACVDDMPRRPVVSSKITPAQKELFSVIISDQVISKIVNEERSHKDSLLLEQGDEEGVYEALSSIGTQEAATLHSILLGKLHTVYIESNRLNTSRSTVISDDGLHVCSKERCMLDPVDGKAFFYEPNRAHVCIPGCIAPATFHVGRERDLSGSLYCCRSSGKAHVCTPESCSAINHDLDGHIVCRLTGKCIGNSKLSAGWIEDNWRPQYYTAAERRKSERKLMTKTKKTRGDDTTRRDLCTHRIADRAKMRSLSRIPEINNKIASTEYRKIYDETIDIVFKIMRPLFPGHISRDIVDANEISRTMSRIVSRWLQYARSCKNDMCMIDTTHMQNENIQLVRSLRRMRVHYDPHTFSAMCNVHARVIVKYATTLFRYTNLSDYDVALTDFVIAILYIQCRSFRVNGTDIIPVDTFLASNLPSASSLREFEHLGSYVFTSTKTAIQACILESNDRGCMLSSVVYPTVNISDMLF